MSLPRCGFGQPSSQRRMHPQYSQDPGYRDPDVVMVPRDQMQYNQPTIIEVPAPDAKLRRKLGLPPAEPTYVQAIPVMDPVEGPVMIPQGPEFRVVETGPEYEGSNAQGARHHMAPVHMQPEPHPQEQMEAPRRFRRKETPKRKPPKMISLDFTPDHHPDSPYRPRTSGQNEEKGSKKSKTREEPFDPYEKTKEIMARQEKRKVLIEKQKRKTDRMKQMEKEGRIEEMISEMSSVEEKPKKKEIASNDCPQVSNGSSENLPPDFFLKKPEEEAEKKRKKEEAKGKNFNPNEPPAFLSGPKKTPKKKVTAKDLAAEQLRNMNENQRQRAKAVATLHKIDRIRRAKMRELQENPHAPCDPNMMDDISSANDSEIMAMMMRDPDDTDVTTDSGLRDDDWDQYARVEYTNDDQEQAEPPKPLKSALKKQQSQGTIKRFNPNEPPAFLTANTERNAPFDPNQPPAFLTGSCSNQEREPEPAIQKQPSLWQFPAQERTEEEQAKYDGDFIMSSSEEEIEFRDPSLNIELDSEIDPLADHNKRKREIAAEKLRLQNAMRAMLQPRVIYADENDSPTPEQAVKIQDAAPKKFNPNEPPAFLCGRKEETPKPFDPHKPPSFLSESPSKKGSGSKKRGNKRNPHEGIKPLNDSLHGEMQGPATMPDFSKLKPVSPRTRPIPSYHGFAAGAEEIEQANAHRYHGHQMAQENEMRHPYARPIDHMQQGPHMRQYGQMHPGAPMGHFDQAHPRPPMRREKDPLLRAIEPNPPMGHVGPMRRIDPMGVDNQMHPGHPMHFAPRPPPPRAMCSSAMVDQPAKPEKKTKKKKKKNKKQKETMELEPVMNPLKKPLPPSLRPDVLPTPLHGRELDISNVLMRGRSEVTPGGLGLPMRPLKLEVKNKEEQLADILEQEKEKQERVAKEMEEMEKEEERMREEEEKEKKKQEELAQLEEQVRKERAKQDEMALELEKRREEKREKEEAARKERLRKEKEEKEERDRIEEEERQERRRKYEKEKAAEKREKERKAEIERVLEEKRKQERKVAEMKKLVEEAQKEKERKEEEERKDREKEAELERIAEEAREQARIQEELAEQLVALKRTKSEIEEIERQEREHAAMVERETKRMLREEEQKKQREIERVERLARWEEEQKLEAERQAVQDKLDEEARVEREKEEEIMRQAEAEKLEKERQEKAIKLEQEQEKLANMTDDQIFQLEMDRMLNGGVDPEDEKDAKSLASDGGKEESLHNSEKDEEINPWDAPTDSEEEPEIWVREDGCTVQNVPKKLKPQHWFLTMPCYDEINPNTGKPMPDIRIDAEGFEEIKCRVPVGPKGRVYYKSSNPNAKKAKQPNKEDDDESKEKDRTPSDSDENLSSVEKEDSSSDNTEKKRAREAEEDAMLEREYPPESRMYNGVQYFRPQYPKTMRILSYERINECGVKTIRDQTYIDGDIWAFYAPEVPKPPESEPDLDGSDYSDEEASFKTIFNCEANNKPCSSASTINLYNYGGGSENDSNAADAKEEQAQSDKSPLTDQARYPVPQPAYSSYVPQYQGTWENRGTPYNPVTPTPQIRKPYPVQGQTDWSGVVYDKKKQDKARVKAEKYKIKMKKKMDQKSIEFRNKTANALRKNMERDAKKQRKLEKKEKERKKKLEKREKKALKEKEKNEKIKQKTKEKKEKEKKKKQHEIEKKEKKIEKEIEKKEHKKEKKIEKKENEKKKKIEKKEKKIEKKEKKKRIKLAIKRDAAATKEIMKDDKQRKKVHSKKKKEIKEQQEIAKREAELRMKQIKLQKNKIKLDIKEAKKEKKKELKQDKLKYKTMMAEKKLDSLQDQLNFQQNDYKEAVNILQEEMESQKTQSSAKSKKGEKSTANLKVTESHNADSENPLCADKAEAGPSSEINHKKRKRSLSKNPLTKFTSKIKKGLKKIPSPQPSPKLLKKDNISADKHSGDGASPLPTKKNSKTKSVMSVLMLQNPQKSDDNHSMSSAYGDGRCSDTCKDKLDDNKASSDESSSDSSVASNKSSSSAKSSSSSESDSTSSESEADIELTPAPINLEKSASKYSQDEDIKENQSEKAQKKVVTKPVKVTTKKAIKVPSREFDCQSPTFHENQNSLKVQKKLNATQIQQSDSEDISSIHKSNKSGQSLKNPVLAEQSESGSSSQRGREKKRKSQSKIKLERRASKHSQDEAIKEDTAKKAPKATNEVTKPVKEATKKATKVPSKEIDCQSSPTSEENQNSLKVQEEPTKLNVTQVQQSDSEDISSIHKSNKSEQSLKHPVLAEQSESESISQRGREKNRKSQSKVPITQSTSMRKKRYTKRSSTRDSYSSESDFDPTPCQNKRKKKTSKHLNEVITESKTKKALKETKEVTKPVKVMTKKAIKAPSKESSSSSESNSSEHDSKPTPSQVELEKQASKHSLTKPTKPNKAKKALKETNEVAKPVKVATKKAIKVPSKEVDYQNLPTSEEKKKSLKEEKEPTILHAPQIHHSDSEESSTCKSDLSESDSESTLCQRNLERRASKHSQDEAIIANNPKKAPKEPNEVVKPVKVATKKAIKAPSKEVDCQLSATSVGNQHSLKEGKKPTVLNVTQIDLSDSEDISSIHESNKSEQSLKHPVLAEQSESESSSLSKGDQKSASKSPSLLSIISCRSTNKQLNKDDNSTDKYSVNLENDSPQHSQDEAIKEDKAKKAPKETNEVIKPVKVGTKKATKVSSKEDVIETPAVKAVTSAPSIIKQALLEMKSSLEKSSAYEDEFSDISKAEYDDDASSDESSSKSSVSSSKRSFSSKKDLGKSALKYLVHEDAAEDNADQDVIETPAVKAVTSAPSIIKQALLEMKSSLEKQSDDNSNQSSAYEDECSDSDKAESDDDDASSDESSSKSLVAPKRCPSVNKKLKESASKHSVDEPKQEDKAKKAPKETNEVTKPVKVATKKAIKVPSKEINIKRRTSKHRQEEVIKEDTSEEEQIGTNEVIKPVKIATKKATKVPSKKSCEAKPESNYDSDDTTIASDYGETSIEYKVPAEHTNKPKQSSSNKVPIDSAESRRIAKERREAKRKYEKKVALARLTAPISRTDSPRGPYKPTPPRSKSCKSRAESNYDSDDTTITSDYGEKSIEYKVPAEHTNKPKQSSSNKVPQDSAESRRIAKERREAKRKYEKKVALARLTAPISRTDSPRRPYRPTPPRSKSYTTRAESNYDSDDTTIASDYGETSIEYKVPVEHTNKPKQSSSNKVPIDSAESRRIAKERREAKRKYEKKVALARLTAPISRTDSPRRPYRPTPPRSKRPSYASDTESEPSTASIVRRYYQRKEFSNRGSSRRVRSCSTQTRQDPANYDEGFQSTRQDNAAGERTTDSGVSFNRHRPTTDVVEYRNQSSPAAQQQNGCMGPNCEMKLNQLIKDCNELKQEFHEFRSAPPPPDYGPQIKELVKDVKELKTRMIVVEGDVKELKSKDCCRGSAHCNSTPSTSQAAASQSTGSTHQCTERVMITPSPTVVVIHDPSATVVTPQLHASSSTSPCSTPSCSRPSCSRASCRTPSCSTLSCGRASTSPISHCPWSNQGDAHNPRDCFKCRVVRLEKKYTKDSEDRKHMREVHNKTVDKLEANKREEKDFLKSVTGDIRDLRKSVDARTNRANESSSRQIRTLVFRVPPGVDWQRIRAGYNSVVNIVRDDARFNTMLTVEEYLNFFKLAYQMAEISKWSAEAFMDNFKHHGLVSGKWFPSELYVQAADDFWKIQRTGRWENI